MNGYGTSPIELMAADAMLRGEVFCEDFVYTFDFTGANVLGASVTVELQTQITSDSDFVIQEMNLVSFTAADTIEVNPDYLLNIVIAGSGRNIFQRPVHVLNVCGNYQQQTPGPGRMPFPRLLQANSTITGSLQNRSAVASVFAQVAMRGFKIFYTGGDRQQIFHVL